MAAVGGSDLDVSDFSTTVDAIAERNFCLIEIPAYSVVLARLFLLCTRASDGATRGITIEILARRQGGDVVLVSQTTPQAHGSAGDFTALQACTIAPYAAEAYIGLQVHGLAGTTIYWSARLIAKTLTYQES
jgi:hypothetical protein